MPHAGKNNFWPLNVHDDDVKDSVTKFHLFVLNVLRLAHEATK